MGNKTLKQLREELLANPDVREAYDEQAPEFALARAIIAAGDRRRLDRPRPRPRALIEKRFPTPFF